MKIVLDTCDAVYTVETNRNDYDAQEMKEMFGRLLCQAGYPPSVIDLDNGHYEWVADDEEVVLKKETEE